MVLLTIFLLAGLDKAINPRSRQSIGKRVRIGLTDDEIRSYTSILGTTKQKKRRR